MTRLILPQLVVAVAMAVLPHGLAQGQNGDEDLEQAVERHERRSPQRRAPPAGGLGAVEGALEPGPGPAPISPPAPGPGAAGQTIPALSGCASGLSGLRPGNKDEMIAYLDRRIAFWRERTWATIRPFRDPRQAEHAHGCFERRLALLASFAPDSDERRAVRKMDDEFRGRWAARIQGFLTGNTSERMDDQWWRDADQAFEALARLEVAIDRADGTTDPERDARVRQARTALAAFAKTIGQVKDFADALDAGKRAFWMRALAWNARQAGLAIDTLQRADFERDPDGAHALLTQQPAPEHGLGTRALLEQVRRLRAERRYVTNKPGERRYRYDDPVEIKLGEPIDWRTLGGRRDALEQLYFRNHMAQTIESAIDAWLREREETKKIDLSLVHDIEVMRGVAEATSRAARDAEWRKFVEDQEKLRKELIEKWGALLKAERMQAVLQGPRIPGPSR